MGARILGLSRYPEERLAYPSLAPGFQRRNLLLCGPDGQWYRECGKGHLLRAPLRAWVARRARRN